MINVCLMWQRMNLTYQGGKHDDFHYFPKWLSQRSQVLLVHRMGRKFNTDHFAVPCRLKKKIKKHKTGVTRQKHACRNNSLSVNLKSTWSKKRVARKVSGVWLSGQYLLCGLFIRLWICGTKEKSQHDNSGCERHQHDRNVRIKDLYKSLDWLSGTGWRASLHPSASPIRCRPFNDRTDLVWGVSFIVLFFHFFVKHSDLHTLFKLITRVVLYPPGSQRGSFHTYYFEPPLTRHALLKWFLKYAVWQEAISLQ